MNVYTERTSHHAVPQGSVTLPFQLRERSRLRVTLDDGTEAGIQLPRGESLLPHDKLRCALADGSESVVEVLAAKETVSAVRCDDPLLYARACYHLGNRHVQLQIDANRLAYLHDHVLDEMLEGLGLTVTAEEACFEPEPGAYGAAHGHHHAHSSEHV